ncbi:hypothetical protein ACFFUB_09650 [Algimonas porphyrae]|uniref:Uncharacterized protein n=1 Tax=Algimonas porphyrae TaxID=1128113 RepID=A0ABQ5V4L7_9PROT|nr:hypothetical protein [Algimonas porphyrae]GLQ21620.1 hypothetical protein GCM10007854_25750 [Algimonas porphyrae]
MFGLVRNIVLIFLILSVAYVILSVTARFKHRRELEAEFDALPDIRRQVMDRDQFIAEGMKAYVRSYRPKLFLGVFIIPSIVIFGLVWLAQYG